MTAKRIDVPKVKASKVATPFFSASDSGSASPWTMMKAKTAISMANIQIFDIIFSIWSNKNSKANWCEFCDVFLTVFWEVLTGEPIQPNWVLFVSHVPLALSSSLPSWTLRPFFSAVAWIYTSYTGTPSSDTSNSWFRRMHKVIKNGIQLHPLLEQYQIPNSLSFGYIYA